MSDDRRRWLVHAKSNDATSSALVVSDRHHRLTIYAMIEPPILPAVLARLAQALAPPRNHYRPLRVDDRIVGWVDDFRAARVAKFADVFVARDADITFVPRLATSPART